MHECQKAQHCRVQGKQSCMAAASTSKIVGWILTLQS